MEESLLQLLRLDFALAMVRTFDSCYLSRGGDNKTSSCLELCEMDYHMSFSRSHTDINQHDGRLTASKQVEEMLLSDPGYWARSR
jgi:hypothetical protein